MVWRFRVAKSGWFCTTTDKEQRAYIFSIQRVTWLKEKDARAWEFLVGPFALIVGYRAALQGEKE